MSDLLRFDDVDADGATVLKPVGEVDIATSPELSRVLTAALREQPQGAVVCCDLSDVTFLDSSGIGVLLAAHRQARQTGRHLCVVGPNPRIHKVLALTAMDRVLSCYDTVGDAIEARPTVGRPPEEPANA